MGQLSILGCCTVNRRTRSADPVFTLRFADESEFTVTVHRGEGDDFALTEYLEPATRSINHEADYEHF
jgi:hypothetical protein